MTTANIDRALERNRTFAATGAHEGAVVFPNLSLFVITPRVDPAHVLASASCDAIVVRNVGGRVSQEVINDVAFIGPIAEAYAERIGADQAILREHAVLDPVATVRHDVERLRSSDAVSPRIAVSGHVYDVVGGLVQTILPAASARV